MITQLRQGVFNIVATLYLFLDLGRMYNLVSRITDGLGELKKLLETHIHNQGLAAIEKCGEAALNVWTTFSLLISILTSHNHPHHA